MPRLSPAAPAQNLADTIIKDIEAKKYEVPTPIQTQGIPIALSGRDILGCAETGSGKTASFAIPMIQHALLQASLRPGDGPIALVLAPTRELAQQIDKEVKGFSTSSQVRTCIVVGGVQMQEQKYDLRNGVEIVVATPGRFNDHLQQGNTNLARVSFVVLDEVRAAAGAGARDVELLVAAAVQGCCLAPGAWRLRRGQPGRRCAAGRPPPASPTVLRRPHLHPAQADRMLDMGFEPQIKDILQQLQPKHQTLLFSATMPVEIEDLARQYLNKPVVCKVRAPGSWAAGPAAAGQQPGSRACSSWAGQLGWAAARQAASAPATAAPPLTPRPPPTAYRRPSPPRPLRRSARSARPPPTWRSTWSRPTTTRRWTC